MFVIMFATVYNLSLSILKFILKTFRFKRIEEWQNGQRVALQEIEQFSFHRPVWFHIASSGEFEQAKPVIDYYTKTNNQVIVTFFSPSGYKAHKQNKSLDGVFYLPLDTTKNVQKFLKLVKPRILILTKYDFWYNYLSSCINQSIPVVLLSAEFRKSHFIFQKYGKPYLELIRKFNYISVQSDVTKQLLEQKGILSEITGDTRIDRSLELPKTDFKSSFLHRFCEDRFCVILASIWPEDEEIINDLEKLVKPLNGRTLIAPHDINKDYLQDLCKNWNAILLSEAKESDLATSTTLIIDKMGILKFIYRYADCAYVGGGFGNGIHNILEPAAYGLPTIFGPNYQKFKEAKDLLSIEAAFSIQNSEEFLTIISTLYENSFRNDVGKKAKHYLEQQSGASKKVISAINTILSES